MAAEHMTTTERIRVAEDRVAQARIALERAEQGLKAMESISARADRVKANPALFVAGTVLVLGLVLLVIRKRRRRRQAEA